jgi:hypothetical protein
MRGRPCATLSVTSAASLTRLQVDLYSLYVYMQREGSEDVRLMSAHRSPSPEPIAGARLHPRRSAA